MTNQETPDSLKILLRALAKPRRGASPREVMFSLSRQLRAPYGYRDKRVEDYIVILKGSIDWVDGAKIKGHSLCRAHRVSQLKELGLLEAKNPNTPDVKFRTAYLGHWFLSEAKEMSRCH